MKFCTDARPPVPDAAKAPPPVLLCKHRADGQKAPVASLSQKLCGFSICILANSNVALDSGFLLARL